MNQRVRVGIVGLGRWARVLTRAAKLSDKIEIVAGYSRSAEKRAAFAAETGVQSADSVEQILARRDIEGMVLTVPNEQHLPVARQVASAGKHVYTEKPIASTLEDGLAIEALQEEFGITVTVGHSARLLGGVTEIKRRIDAGELGRVGFIEANFSNERALELTPSNLALVPGPCARRAASPSWQFTCLTCELPGEQTSLMRVQWPQNSPRLAREVDDQSMTILGFSDGAIAYVGSCWTSPGVFSLRVFGSSGLIHYEIDFGAWDTPEQIRKSSSLYIQRGKDGYGKRQRIEEPETNMFVAELDMFAESLPQWQAKHAQCCQRQYRRGLRLCRAAVD